jgi:UDP-galactopyranose mutase
MPINLQTIAQITNKFLNPHEAQKWIQSHNPNNQNSTSNFESKAIAAIGTPLYEALIKGYTHKQWDVDPKLLPESVFTRLPIRFNLNNDYFSDEYQGLPRNGYGELFDKMVSNSNIDVMLNTNYFELKDQISPNQLVVYTGPIDEYFGYSEGKLGWRTLDFTLERHETEDFQGASVMNYADLEDPWTRIHEFKHLHPKRETALNKTIIAREFSRTAELGDEPYYPINRPEDRVILGNYRKLIETETTIFGGRLGSYQYLDMHMAIGSAFSIFENEIHPRLSKGHS